MPLTGGLGGTTCRCGGGLAKQMAGNVENGEASTLLRMRLEVRFDENLDGLFAGVDLDTDRRVAEVDLVASSVLSSNDGVRHCSLGQKEAARKAFVFDSVVVVRNPGETLSPANAPAEIGGECRQRTAMHMAAVVEMTVIRIEFSD